MTDYLAYATTATGVPITECEVCGQRHPVTRAHCSRCRSWSAFQRSGLCLICSEIVAAHGVSEGSREAIRTPVRYNLGVDNESAPEALERPEGLVKTGTLLDSLRQQEGARRPMTSPQDSADGALDVQDGHLDARSRCVRCKRFVAQSTVRAVRYRPAAGWNGEVDEGHDSHPECGTGVLVEAVVMWVRKRRKPRGVVA